MRRTPSDRALRRWLETGRPAHIGHAAGTDNEIAARLEAMTALRQAHVDALAEVIRPAPGFESRVSAGVRQRVDTYGTVSLLADMLGVGFRVGRTLLGHDDEPDQDPTR